MTSLTPGAFAAVLAAAMVSNIAAFARADAVGREAPAPRVVDSQLARFEVVVVAEGLHFPWSMAILPDGRALVVEKPGRLELVAGGSSPPVALEGSPDDVYYGRQSGLHGIALHPRFAANSLVYLAYAAGSEEANRPVLMRYRLDGDTLRDPVVIFRSEQAREGPSHSGGRMLFLPDGTLLLSVGHVLDFLDTTKQSQNVGNVFGSIVRLHDDGCVPADNPFVGVSRAAPEIHSFGHRNVQGLALRPGSDQVWAVEHGPRGGDELNLIEPGRNYGWPLATYGVDYDGSSVSDRRELPGTVGPVWYWAPSIAPSSLAFYDGDAFSAWRGDLLVSALKGMQLQRLTLHEDHVIGIEPLLTGFGRRIRQVVVGPDGLVYLLTDESSAGILKLVPVPDS